MMKRRNGEIVVKRSSRYAKRPTKSYTGEHFLSSNYGTVLKMLTLFCIVLFGDYCLGNFRLEYIWPLWLCMNSMMDAYKMQGLGFAVFFIGIVVTSDIICFLLVPVRWLFLIASSYVWLQYVISSERGLCIQTVVLWILFVYVESCIRVRELNRYLSPSSAMFLAPPSSLWPDSGGDGSVPPDSLTSQLFLNTSAEAAAGATSMQQQQQNDMAISAAAAASSVSAASSTTLSRIGGDMTNDSSLSASSPSPWLLWSLITSATPGFLGSSLPLRLELCRPLAAHCTGYPLITLTTALKSFVVYRLKRSRQRQFAKENQQLKDLLFHALPDDVQQKQRSQLFSTFSLASSSPSLAANSNSTVNGYSSSHMQQPSFPSSSATQQQVFLSNGPGSANMLTSNSTWLANNNGYGGGGLSDLTNNNFSSSSAGLSHTHGDSLGLLSTSTLQKSSSSGRINSGAPAAGASPAHRAPPYTSSSYSNPPESASSSIVTTPVSAYAGNNNDSWSNSWTATPSSYANSTGQLVDDGGSSWLSSTPSMSLNKGTTGGAFQLRSSKTSSATTTSSHRLQSKTQQRSLNAGGSSSRSLGVAGNKNSSSTSTSYNNKSSTNSKTLQNDPSSKLMAQQQPQAVGTSSSSSASGSGSLSSFVELLTPVQQRPKPQPQFAIIAKIFSAIGSVLFSTSSSSRISAPPSRRGSVTLSAADARKTAAVETTTAGGSATTTKSRHKNFDLLDNDDLTSLVEGDNNRSRHAQHVRRRTAAACNGSKSILTTHSSRSSSNSRSNSGESFRADERRNYDDDDDPSSNAEGSDNEYVAADDENVDEAVAVGRNNNADNADDAVYETATVNSERGGGDAVSRRTEARKSAAVEEEHLSPPSYESLALSGAGDASAVMANGKMVTTKNHREATNNKNGRRRRAMTASTPTPTSSAADYPATESVVTAEQQPSQQNNNNKSLEVEHRRLKSDLSESRQTEQELRSQLTKIGIDQQSLRSDNVQLQKQNDSLQQRLHEVGSTRTREKKDAGAIEKKLAEEAKKRSDAEKSLERERRAHAKDLEDSHKREVEVEKMRGKLSECEQELLQIRQDLKAKEDEARKYGEENRRLEQYRSAQKDTDVLLSALSAMQDKNMHMENSLTAETKLKLELFTALGDAKKDLDQYKTLVFKRENEIKELKECIRRLSAAAASAPQQPKVSAPTPMPSISNNTSSLADVLSNGFSTGLGLSNGTTNINKQSNMARLNSLSVLDHHKFGSGMDSLGSTLGQHFGSSGSGGGVSGVSSAGVKSSLHHMHNHHQQTLNDALASFGSTSSSSPGFLHEYTSGNSTSTPPLVSQGGNGGGVSGGNGLFGELGYGSHHLNNNNHSYYSAAVQQQQLQSGGGANRSTPSPSSVPGSAAAAAALQGGSNMRSSPSVNNNGSSSTFPRW